MLFIEPHAGIAPFVRFIAGARGALDINAYLLTDRKVVKTIRAAVDRGVTVRVLVARRPYGGRPHGEIARLDASGAQVRFAPRRFSGPYVFDHAKYMVSGDTAEIGSANLTWSAFHKNREYVWIGHNMRVAHALHTVFLADWRRTPAGPLPRRRLVLAPGATAALVRVLKRPGRICIETEELGRDRALLAALRRRGAAIRLLLPSRLSSYDRSIARLVASYGVHIRYLTKPYLHAKLIAAAHQAFIGSENFTATSLHHNREVGILLTGRDARMLNNQCAYDWALGVP